MATSITHQTATQQTATQQTATQQTATHQTVNQKSGMGRTRTRSCFSVGDSAAGRGATRQESAPNRVQLEILFQGEWLEVRSVPQLRPPLLRLGVSCGRGVAAGAGLRGDPPAGTPEPPDPTRPPLPQLSASLSPNRGILGRS